MSPDPSPVPAVRLRPSVEVFRAPAGPVTFPAAPELRLRVHASGPVRGACGPHRFVYERGHVDLVPAGMSDGWLGEAASESLVLTLPRALLERAADELGRPERAGVEPRCLFRDARIEHVAWALGAEHEAGNPGGSPYAEALGLALAFHVLGGYSVPTPRARGLSNEERARVTAYVEAYLDRDLSLVTLAAVAGKSASHFKTLFRRSMGVPVHEYVVQRRVERAKALLLRAEQPAAEIALATGFAHQSHMARCMRRVLGVTPTELAPRGASPGSPGSPRSAARHAERA